MPTLVWDQTSDQLEVGISHGVFYPGSGAGVVWNGIQSVEESPVGGEQVSSYLDGVKYLDSVGARNYQATLKAFSAPKGFDEYFGERSIKPGVRLGRQPKKRFHFSYRTSRQIHLVYNVLASANAKDHATLGGKNTPTSLSWTLDATPVFLVGFRPTAHIVVSLNGTNPETLAALEDILYGTGEDDSFFPPAEVLFALFGEGP